MRAEYKRLGDYIQQVDVRNTDVKVSQLVGLTIDKAFIKSVANTIGTDFSKYKVIRRNQFACSLMQVSRDGKMPVAMFEGDVAIMSPAYPMFEVVSKTDLLPEYLMLWFSRSEFDREASFYAVGGVRGSLEWDDFCNMRIPVPSIEKQRRIVAQYQTVENRIKNNERLIVLLEDTAQTIFRHRFVDNIDTNNLPEGWRMGTVGELFELQRGFDLPEQNRHEGNYPIYASTGITSYHNEFKVTAPGVVTGRSGTIGKVMYVHNDFWPLNTTLYVKNCSGSSFEFAYYKLQELQLDKTVAGFAAVPTLNRNDVHAMRSIIPPKTTINEFSRISRAIFSYIEVVRRENDILRETANTLTSKL